MDDRDTKSFLVVEHSYGNGFTIKYEPKRNKEKADRSNKVGDATFHVLILTPELTFSGKLAEDQQTVATELEKAIRRYPEFWWGWGLILTMRPDFIREARRRGDYATSILGKDKERPQGVPEV